MKILVVDDDPLFRGALERILRAAGHEMCWSATGHGGLALMRSETPDAVILDIKFAEGEMTGWEVAREKLLDPSIRSIPLIIVSGLAEHDVRAGARVVQDALAGATLILGKPIDSATLLRAIAHLGNGKKN